MCTVTYLPVSRSSYVLTSSRDESTSRIPALTPEKFRIGVHTILFPKDRQGNGTWIATSINRTVCLLNGAFKPHTRFPTYRHSRGKVVLDAFSFTTIYEFASGYNLKNIEPFTLICVEKQALIELRWNGRRLYQKELDHTIPHIWSSVTLYNPAMGNKRKQWFNQWLAITREYGVEKVREFHKQAGEGNPATSILMNRNNEVRTISLTSILMEETGVEMIYEDLLSGQIHKSILDKTRLSIE